MAVERISLDELALNLKQLLQSRLKKGTEREHSLREHWAELLPHQGRDLGCWLWQGGENCGSTIHKEAASVG